MNLLCKKSTQLALAGKGIGGGNEQQCGGCSIRDKGRSTYPPGRDALPDSS